MSYGTVSVSYLRIALLAAGDGGVSAPALLDRAGIPAETLEDPEGRVPFAQYVALVNDAAARAQDDAFGVRMGRMIQRNHHATTLLVMTGPTLGAVFEQTT